MSYLERARRALDELAAGGLRRTIREGRGGLVDFSSNDYLGLARHEAVLAALRGADRAGSSGARLLAGAYPEHSALEEALAALVRREAALLFSSGYLAALGAIGALARCVDHAYSDRLNHASLIDGLRATKLPRTIYPHRELPPKRPAGGLVVSETIFGMDGDAADVRALVGALLPQDVLLLDEAHALGVAGPRGGGLAAELDDPRIVVLGTLSKALGALGGFIAGPRTVIELLKNTARTFIFDTSLPPALAAAAHAAVRIAGSAEGDERRGIVRGHVARLRRLLGELGYGGGGAGAVIPVVLGEADEALAASRALEERGFRVPAIRPPTVPPGSSRLRITVRADHTAAQIEALGEALQGVLGERLGLR